MPTEVKSMGDLELAGWITVGLFALISIVSSIVVHEERKGRRGLPKPRDDERNWSDAHMRDVKSWRTR